MRVPEVVGVEYITLAVVNKPSVFGYVKLNLVITSNQITDCHKIY